MSCGSILKEEQEKAEIPEMSMMQGHGESAPEMPQRIFTESELRQQLEEQRQRLAEEARRMVAEAGDPFPRGVPTQGMLRDWYARNFGKDVPPEPYPDSGSKGKSRADDDDDYCPRPPNGGREFNVGKPGEYDGSHNSLQTWLMQVEGYLNLKS
ncbi:hypothetical protein M404DRAFT_22226 [Pisolithus tinctorius Marx 270]|uniref:Uncharacterized protein n=1 Tax=Pisolithus tinctorius Marx 270 TaxID=870435 RepID=A0A0C3PK47_PISTI|nr:hypothetical protein M404DRAFT_22226 [Pisolithus tinctorius Marx 270]